MYYLVPLFLIPVLVYLSLSLFMTSEPPRAPITKCPTEINQGTSSPKEVEETPNPKATNNLIPTSNVEEANIISTVNPTTLYEEGLNYYHAKEWDRAIDLFNQVLALQPDNEDARLFLAYSYLLRFQSKASLEESEQLFRQILEKVPDYKDAQDGLARTEELIKVFDKAKEAVMPEVKPQPRHKHKRKVRPPLKQQAKPETKPVNTAEPIIEPELEHLKPETAPEPTLKPEPDTKPSSEPASETAPTSEPTHKEEAPKSAPAHDLKSEPKVPSPIEILLDAAKKFTDEENYWAALELYTKVIDIAPSNSEHLFFLGRTYARLGYHTTAMVVFEDALAVKSDNSDVLIALGNEYLFFNDPYSSLYLFGEAASISPQDQASWVGLASSEILLGFPEYAEEYYAAALDAAPKDTDVWAAYGGFLLSQKRYAEGEQVYRYIDFLKGDRSTYRYTLFDNASYTNPTLYARGGAAEEKEKDVFTHSWVASMKYWNAEIGLYYPASDHYRFSARFREGETKQTLLLSNRTQFNYKSRGGSIRAECFYNPYWTFVADAGAEWISNLGHNDLLPTKRGVKFEPTITFRYVKAPHTVLFGETTDTIPFRDFTKMHVRVITRESALFSYQYDFDDKRLLGFDGAWIWYQDPISNQEQDANIWAQVGIPGVEDYVTARYHCEYRRFNHEVSGYYSFQYQLTQWLKFRFFRKWLFGGRVDLEYWHGWRTTRGRNPQQQIIVIPTVLGPVVTVLNQIDQVNLTLGFNPTEYCDFSVFGSYYHDSFDYTIVAIKGTFDWRF